jgi:hypothetical protein
MLQYDSGLNVIQVDREKNEQLKQLHTLRSVASNTNQQHVRVIRMRDGPGGEGIL